MAPGPARTNDNEVRAEERQGKAIVHGGAEMATILEFRAQVARYPEFADQRDRTRSAEVVIFPGVRYERDVQPEAQPAKPRGRRSRQRDRLELEE